MHSALTMLLFSVGLESQAEVWSALFRGLFFVLLLRERRADGDGVQTGMHSHSHTSSLTATYFPFELSCWSFASRIAGPVHTGTFLRWKREKYFNRYGLSSIWQRRTGFLSRFEKIRTIRISGHYDPQSSRRFYIHSGLI